MSHMQWTKWVDDNHVSSIWYVMVVICPSSSVCL